MSETLHNWLEVVTEIMIYLLILFKVLAENYSTIYGRLPIEIQPEAEYPEVTAEVSMSNLTDSTRIIWYNDDHYSDTAILFCTCWLVLQDL